MLSVFLDAVLPVFIVVAAGYVFGRTGLFSFDAASAINRLVIQFAVPISQFRLVATVMNCVKRVPVRTGRTRCGPRASSSRPSVCARSRRR